MRVLQVGALVAACLLVGQANAAIIFSDNFDAETLELNAALDNWSVGPGAVDVIGLGFIDLIPGNGNYVDLDGTTNQAGTITSAAFQFLNGVHYELKFDLAGNQRGFPADTVHVTLGSFFDVFVTLDSPDPLTTFSSGAFTGDGSFAQIVFAHSGADQRGILLDNVVLQTVPVQGQVPEPASIALFGIGAIGLAGLRRRQKAAVDQVN